MRRFLVALVVMLALGAGGCQSGAKDPTPSANSPTGGTGASDVEPPKDDAERLQQQLRAGAYQVDAALDQLEALTTKLHGEETGHGPDAKSAALDMKEFLDSAGSTLGDYTVAPTLEEARTDFAALDEHRLKAIDDINDARREVMEAAGIAEPLAEEHKDPTVKAAFSAISDDVEEIIDTLKAAIESLGGTAEEPSED